MNYTQKKLNLKTLFALLLVVLFAGASVFAKMAASAEMAAGRAGMAMADMAAPEPKIVSRVSETISFYTDKQRKQKLSENEADILKLSVLAQDVFEIKDFMIPAYLKAEKEKAITTVYVASVIQQAIEKKSDWDESLSAASFERVKENSELLKKSLNESSYSWAWINYQIGQKDIAKKILQSKFVGSYDNVMKLRHVYNHHASPMVEAERLFKALKPMSNDDENKTREDQMKKMRTHVSTLPDMQIMT